MKSPLLTFYLAIMAALPLSAQDNIPQPTHYVVKIAATSLVPLKNSSEDFIYRDSNGHTYETKSNVWKEGFWVLDDRAYYTLNALGNPTQILEKKWVEATSTLVNAKRTTIGYHPNGLENYRRTEIWNISNNIWQTQEITILTFEPNDKVKEITLELYTNGAVTSSHRTIYAYDAADRVLERIRQTRYTGAWTNDEKTDYTYNDADEYYDASFLRYWDDSAGAWGDVTVHGTQTVASTQRITQSERWNGVAWIPGNRNTTDYDANNQKTVYVSEAWDGDAADWQIQARQEFAYNTDLSRLQIKYFNKDFSTGLLYLYAVVDYDYGSYAVSTQTPPLLAKVSISPNPTTDIVQVQIEGGGSSNITLLDLHGKVVTQTSTMAKTAYLSLSGQANGTYFLKIEQGNAIKVLPVVKF